MEKLRIGVEGTQADQIFHIGPSTPVLIKDQITKENFFRSFRSKRICIEF